MSFILHVPADSDTAGGRAGIPALVGRLIAMPEMQPTMRSDSNDGVDPDRTIRSTS